MLRFKLHHLFAFSLLLTSLCQRPAKAVGVSFDLAPSSVSVANSESFTRETPQEIVPAAESPSTQEQFEALTHP